MPDSSGEILHKLAMPIGVELAGGKMLPLLEENTYYPTKEPALIVFRTTYVDQTSLQILIYEGRDSLTARNSYLGKAVAKLPPGLPINTAVEFLLSIDRDGILQVGARLYDHTGANLVVEFIWKENKTSTTPQPAAAPVKPAAGAGSRPVVKAAQPVTVTHPYANTPYDQLSFPQEADIGIVGPDSSQEQIRTIHGKVLRRRLRDPRQAVEVMDRLRGANRLAVDIFLVSTFNPGADLTKTLELFRMVKSPQPPAPPIGVQDELDYWRDLPELNEIHLSEVTLTRSTEYDDPLSELVNVEFDR